MKLFMSSPSLLIKVTPGAMSGDFFAEESK